ncbi:MAG: hypothetical protein K6A65_05275, partial [Succinivibrionaceae bacterium]|nr:hypothetical protein [Succinivibrionaceae bacterium]
PRETIDRARATAPAADREGMARAIAFLRNEELGGNEPGEGGQGRSEALRATLGALKGRFAQREIPLSDMRPSEPDESGRFEIEHGGESLLASRRFIKSVARQMKFSDNIFSLFTPAEVFARISEHHPRQAFRVTVDTETGVLLAARDAQRPALPADTALDVLGSEARLIGLDYNEGDLLATLSLNSDFSIADDSLYERRIDLLLPVDGLRNPTIFLKSFREICANGLAMMVPEMRTDVILSDSDGSHLSRILRSFNNEQGFETMQERLKAASVTPASLDEVLRMDQALTRAVASSDDRDQLSAILEALAGEPCRKNRVTSLEALEEKRRKALAADCNVGELINMGTELVTHYPVAVRQPQRLERFLSSLLVSPFDFEQLSTRMRAARPFYLEGFTAGGAPEPQVLYSFANEYGEDDDAYY